MTRRWRVLLAITLRACKLSLPYACTAVVTLRRSELGEVLGLTNELCAANLRVSRAAFAARAACAASQPGQAASWRSPGFWIPPRVATRPQRSRHAANNRPWLGNPHISTLSSRWSLGRRRVDTSCSDVQAHAEEDPHRPRPQGTRRGCLATAKRLPSPQGCPGKRCAPPRPLSATATST